MAIDQAIIQVFADFQLNFSLIKGLGTIDRKAHDPAIEQVCQSHKWQLYFFSSVELAIVPVPSRSATVQQQVQTLSVAEAAALLAAGAGGKLLVTKQIYRLAGLALTIAVAQAADADKIGCC